MRALLLSRSLRRFALAASVVAAAVVMTPSAHAHDGYGRRGAERGYHDGWRHGYGDHHRFARRAVHVHRNYYWRPAYGYYSAHAPYYAPPRYVYEAPGVSFGFVFR